jgi:hypothetical protein
VRRAPRPPSALACAATLFGVRLALRTAGFGRTLAAVRRLGRRGGELSDAGGVVPATVAALELAAAFVPFRAICLEQSLALYLLLRRRGVPAVLRIGVRPYPFTAHAWVELDGEPLNEQEELVRHLMVMEEAVG